MLFHSPDSDDDSTDWSADEFDLLLSEASARGVAPDLVLSPPLEVQAVESLYDAFAITPDEERMIQTFIAAVDTLHWRRALERRTAAEVRTLHAWYALDARATLTPAPSPTDDDATTPRGDDAASGVASVGP